MDALRGRRRRPARGRAGQRPAARRRCTCSPGCGGLLETGLEYGALGAMVSGSGPTCAFLVDSESDAVDLSVALSAEGLCRSVRRATGPVLGARVIG